jgi:outer membrane protein assembly factor BamB
VRILLAILILFSSSGIDRFDPGRTGVCPELATPPFVEESQILVLDDNGVTASPVIMENILYIGTTSGSLKAIDCKTLKVIWSTSIKGSFRSSVLVHKGKVFIGDTNGKMHCFDSATGKALWPAVDFVEWINSSPLPENDRIIFGANDRKIHALDVSTGKKVWSSVLLKGQVQAGVAKFGENYIVGCFGQKDCQNCNEPGNLYCINPKGEIVWGPKITYGSVQGTPAVLDNSVYVTSQGYTWEDENRPKGRISCFNATSGLHVWSQKLGGEIWGSPAVDKEVVVVGCRDHFVWCFDPSSGDKKWHFQTESLIDASPVISGKYVFIGSLDGYVYILNKSTGQLMQKLKVGTVMQGPSGSIAIWEGSIFVLSIDGNLHKFKPAPLGKIWMDDAYAQTLEGDYNFHFVVKNLRQDTLAEPLRAKVEIDSPYHNQVIPEIVLLPGESKLFEIKGKADFGEKHGDISSFIKLAWTNAPIFEVVEAGQNKPGNSIEFKLNVISKNPTLKVTPNSLDYGLIWDDEPGKIIGFEITNPGTGKLVGTIERPNIVAIDVNDFSLDSNSSLKINSKLLMIEFGKIKFDEKNILSFNRPLQIKSNGGNAELAVTGTIKRSKLWVKVSIGNKESIVNGEKKTLLAAPYIKSGTTMVPIRVISEGLGLKVEWIFDIKTVMIDLTGGRFLRLIIGYPSGIIEEPDGTIKEVSLKVPAEIIKGTTFVPLRFISENLSSGDLRSEVVWNAVERSATATRWLKPKK